MPSLPIPDLLNSIASGAHYSGGHQERAADRPLHPKPWRARSRERSSDDPEVELRFKDVMDDLEQVSNVLAIIIDSKGDLRILQLYCCKPTPEIIQRRFRADATVDHPWFTCAGIRDIAAVIFAMVSIQCCQLIRKLMLPFSRSDSSQARNGSLREFCPRGSLQTA